jgi:hypothetical protein
MAINLAERPTLITFDIFGTVLDWRGGMEAGAAPWKGP